MEHETTSGRPARPSFTQLLERLIPAYARLPLLVMLVCNCGVYWLGRALAAGRPHLCMELPADRLIPVLPWTTLIYFGCYLFWVVNYILATRPDRETALRFAAGELLGKLACLAFFVFLPTTAIRPEATGAGFFDGVLRLLYRLDAPDNLFPSIHCYVSWMCFIGVRRQKRVPAWYRAFSCLMALAVFVSTLTTKQHVLADVAAGALLAELCSAAAALVFRRRGRAAPRRTV